MHTMRIMTRLMNRASNLLICSWAALLLGLASIGSCTTINQTSSTSSSSSAGAKEFVGSASCESCHQDIYTRWKDTLMANVLQDPRTHPAAILGDFSKPHPLVTFRREDIAFTYGTEWKQRYFTKRGDDYFVQPAQWDVKNKVWRQYYVRPGTDWWTAFYPADQMERPTGPLCDGCHSVNYNINTKAVTEWNVGCEKCHGAGSAHLNNPIAATIINPAKLDEVRADDVCIQCHSQGQPRTNPIEGRYYDWPVGYQPGDRLSDFWRLEEHHFGEETFTHWPDGTAHKNRMQGNDYVQSQMYVKGVRCYACHDTHGTRHEADLRLPGNAVCLQCHNGVMQPGPRGSIEFHTQHAADSEGSKCIACHMPAIAQTIADVNVRSHTFKFIPPALSERHGMPNACTKCHTDKSAGWATEALAKWPNVSPWRVAQ
jgi:predicted CXXCH cytochrome family protein